MREMGASVKDIEKEREMVIEKGRGKVRKGKESEGERGKTVKEREGEKYRVKEMEKGEGRRKK